MASRLLHRPLLHRRTPTSPPSIQHRNFAVRVQNPAIRTLNPKSLTEYDFRDLSGWESASPLNTQVGRFKYFKGGIYPNQTTGFYYYWTHPDLPPTAGQLRFRLTPSNDPSLFKSGSDLLKPNGLPWTVSVARLFGLQKAYYAHILLEDGLVTKDLISSEYFRLHRQHRLQLQSVLLQSFEEVFPLDLPCRSQALNMVTPRGVESITTRLGDHSWVEDLKLVEPGKQVYAHARLQVYDLKEQFAPALRVVRMFSPSGEELVSDFPLIKLYYVNKAFQSWYLQVAKDIVEGGHHSHTCTVTNRSSNSFG
ncbi:hypothetical protein EDD85DRAFT_435829 [Armillaria nabsnona]|nr:hypothetical protein EDD85DRAFT_435829 [Armillaria nabsnona]